jgi:transposase
MKNLSRLLRQNVGVDVSKDTLDVVFSTIDLQQHIRIKACRKFANTTAGFEQLHQWVESKRDNTIELRILMEATGIYYEQLAWLPMRRNTPYRWCCPPKRSGICRPSVRRARMIR